jgi:hypothetical protein
MVPRRSAAIHHEFVITTVRIIIEYFEINMLSTAVANSLGSHRLIPSQRVSAELRPEYSISWCDALISPHLRAFLAFASSWKSLVAR